MCIFDNYVSLMYKASVINNHRWINRYYGCRKCCLFSYNNLLKEYMTLSLLVFAMRVSVLLTPSYYEKTICVGLPKKGNIWPRCTSQDCSGNGPSPSVRRSSKVLFGLTFKTPFTDSLIFQLMCQYYIASYSEHTST